MYSTQYRSRNSVSVFKGVEEVGTIALIPTEGTVSCTIHLATSAGHSPVTIMQALLACASVSAWKLAFPSLDEEDVRKELLKVQYGTLGPDSLAERAIWKFTVSSQWSSETILPEEKKLLEQAKTEQEVKEILGIVRYKKLIATL